MQKATERPPGLLVLQAPYTSVETRAAELYPFVIGVRHLVRDKYDSLRHGETLFAAANQPKTMVVYSEAHHDDYSGGQILTPLVKTARKYGLI